jgi:hypothetical protein
MARIRYSRRLYAHRLRVTRLVLCITEEEAATAHAVLMRTYRRWENGGRAGPANFCIDLSRLSMCRCSPSS